MVSDNDIHGLIGELERAFDLQRDEKRADAMTKYLKGKFPFFGIGSPQRKQIQKAWINKIPSTISDETRRLIIRELWQKEEREFHYVAIDWLNSWNKKHILKEDDVLLRWLIVNHSWWDSVDSIASNYLGKYLLKFPEKKKTLIEDWRHDNNMWLNRSCLIFQLKYAKNVDFELLSSLIKQYQPVKEFFIQKAIGWSLRQYSKFDPERVSAFVHEIDLKGLARKEANKYL
jgi:3-methyladenine DNA glycosylase AlkD